MYMHCLSQYGSPTKTGLLVSDIEGGGLGFSDLGFGILKYQTHTVLLLLIVSFSVV